MVFMGDHENWKEKTGSITGHDGKILFSRNYEPLSEEKARLLIAHGLGEHSGRYMNVVQRLLPLGIAIRILDHRGHGQSDGIRGHVMAFDEYVSDLRVLVESARKDLPKGRKLLLLGHSMGGLIALKFAMKQPEMIDGLIVSSPGLGMKVAIPAVKGILGKLMSSLWPGLTLGNELDPTKISHDELVIKAYQADPLVHDRVSARWFTEFLASMEWVQSKASELKVPFLMQIAGDDQLVNAEASKSFFAKLTLADKTLKVYDGLYHEIYNETEKERAIVLGDLQNWLMTRCLST
jgi:alpha-beta hydrolase superfamily lysophospholipase